MEGGFGYYLGVWLTLVAVAVLVVAFKGRSMGLLDRRHLRFLMEPWRALTFLVAGGSMTLAAPYSGDPTWDYVDGGAMSLLTYFTATWSVGTIYRFAKGWSSMAALYVAFCLALFSASWFYDGYILFRDGIYPPAWSSNLLISSTLYVGAGLFWSLDWRGDEGAGKIGGATFVFQKRRWYEEAESGGFGRFFWVALLFIGFGAYTILWFVWDELKVMLGY